MDLSHSISDPFKTDDDDRTDNSEQVNIAALALLKMLSHAKEAVPVLVLGLALGEVVNTYEVRIVDVFSLPRHATRVSRDAWDPAYVADILHLHKQTGRDERVVGWYHSNPSFSCWLSSTGISINQSFEEEVPRAVAIVIDLVQSGTGKVVIGAFRVYKPEVMLTCGRQTTSNIGHLNKPSSMALNRGLNTSFYSLVISYRMNEHERQMLVNLSTPKWFDRFTIH